jgi:hypothetical protein
MIRTLLVIALLSLTSAGVVAHGGTTPRAAHDDLLVDGPYGGAGRCWFLILPVGAWANLVAPPVAIYRDLNGDGLIDRNAHEDDPSTPEDESHGADERVVGPVFSRMVMLCAFL